MELGEIEIGLRIEVKKLGDTEGMMIKRKYLDVRTVGVKGTVIGYVPGHGGDVWWIKHDDDNIGAYTFDEFEKE